MINKSTQYQIMAVSQADGRDEAIVIVPPGSDPAEYLTDGDTCETIVAVDADLHMFLTDRRLVAE